jgi:putative FmdB family regulatory protein
MPTYEYRCKDCGEHLEVVQAFTDDALTECPACKGELRKVFGNIGITFKGSGFYKTDSRSKKSATKSSDTKADSTSDSSSSSGSDTKSDSKSDSKSDTKSTEKKSDTSSTKSSPDAKTA